MLIYIRLYNINIGIANFIIITIYYYIISNKCNFYGRLNNIRENYKNLKFGHYCKKN